MRRPARAESPPAKQEAIAQEHAPSAQVSKQQVSSEQKPAEQSSNTARHAEAKTNVSDSPPVILLPSEIATADGKTYKGTELLRVEADGLAVTFQPAGGGIGMAKLKFRNLPESLQRQYGYDTQKAAAYEAERERGLKEVHAKMWTDFRLACKAAAEIREDNEREMARREEERIQQEQERLRLEVERKRAEDSPGQVAGWEDPSPGFNFNSDGNLCPPDTNQTWRGGPVQVSRGFGSTLLPAYVSNNEINAAYQQLPPPGAPSGKK